MKEFNALESATKKKTNTFLHSHLNEAFERSNADEQYFKNVNQKKFQVAAVYVSKLFCTLHFSHRFPSKSWFTICHFRHYTNVRSINGYAVKAKQRSRQMLVFGSSLVSVHTG